MTISKKDRFKKFMKERLLAFGVRVFPSYMFSPKMDYQESRKFSYLSRMVDRVKSLEGGFVECGVGQGSSFVMLCYAVRCLGLKTKLWGFDSFEGFPPRSIFDNQEQEAEGVRWRGAREKEIFSRLAAEGMSRFAADHVILVKGFFEDTVSKTEVGKISLLHIDVDLYDSYKVCLETFYPKVVKGGVVMFDEYRSVKDTEKWPGAARAIDEYLGPKRSLIRQDEISGKFYLIKE